MIIIISPSGMRLCKDRKWRSFANFGTFGSCVKTYKTLGGAKRVCNELGQRGVQAAVLQMEDEGLSINSAGQIQVKVPTSPGYHKVLTVPMDDYIVHRNYAEQDR